MKKAFEIPLEIFGAAAGFIAVSAAIYMPFVVADAKRIYCDDCDYLMILGGNVIGADTPSPQLVERMKKAASYLLSHPECIAVPCGGCFREGQKKSEADIIADYLIQSGIGSDRIIREDKSTTTFQNFEFGLPLIENHNNGRLQHPRIGFLSSSYHIHRASLIAKKYGITDPRKVTASTPGKAFPRFVREYFVAYQFLTEKAGEILKW